MEEVWKRFKQETKEDLLKIKEFLNETSLNEKSDQQTKRISRHLVLDKETLTAIKANKKPKASSRKKIYGRLKNLVKEIIEKENISRAQAYRKAKSRLLNI